MTHAATSNDNDGKLTALAARVEQIAVAVQQLVENQKASYDANSVLSTEELAGVLAVTPRTIARWRSERMPMLQAKRRGPVRYRLGDVLAWLERRKPTRRPT